MCDVSPANFQRQQNETFVLPIVKNQMTPNEQSEAVRGKVGAAIQDQLCCIMERSRIVRTGFERGGHAYERIVCPHIFSKSVTCKFILQREFHKALFYFQ